jgi:prepilin-type N-terminal cleavage/methylation domain-containing protein
MQTRLGFTFIEILIVLAVLGLITSLATVNLQGLRERSGVRQAATDYAVILRQARTLAQRYNANVSVQLTGLSGGFASGYSLTQVRSSGSVTQTYTLPGGVRAKAATSGGETTLIYQAPYGEVVSSGLSISFESTRTSSIAVTVGAVGLTGKVVIY